MCLFQTHKRFIQIGTIFGVAPYRLTNRYFETSTRATLMSILISLTNLFIISRLLANKITKRESYESKPFGYTLIYDGVTFLSYSSGCFLVGGVFFSRKKLISHMNRLTDHAFMQKTYEFEQKPVRNFRMIISGIVGYMFFNLIVGTSADGHFMNTFEIILTVPLLISCVLILVQFLIAVQIIYLSYFRIQHELRTGRLTVEKLRQCCLLDILLKDYGNVVQSAYGPFNFVYISLSFLYVLTIELYVAEGGPTFVKMFVSYMTAVQPLTLFVWYIWKCTLVTREVENTLQCLHGVAMDVEDRDVREAVELFSLQLLGRDLKFQAGGCYSLDFTLLYSMVGAVTSYVVTLLQFQAAFHS